jgi:hypothetical protein
MPNEENKPKFANIIGVKMMEFNPTYSMRGVNDGIFILNRVIKKNNYGDKSKLTHIGEGKHLLTHKFFYTRKLNAFHS